MHRSSGGPRGWSAAEASRLSLLYWWVRRDRGGGGRQYCERRRGPARCLSSGRGWVWQVRMVPPARRWTFRQQPEVAPHRHRGRSADSASPPGQKRAWNWRRAAPQLRDERRVPARSPSREQPAGRARPAASPGVSRREAAIRAADRSETIRRQLYPLPFPRRQPRNDRFVRRRFHPGGRSRVRYSWTYLPFLTKHGGPTPSSGKISRKTAVVQQDRRSGSLSDPAADLRGQGRGRTWVDLKTRYRLATKFRPVPTAMPTSAAAWGGSVATCFRVKSAVA